MKEGRRFVVRKMRRSVPPGPGVADGLIFLAAWARAEELRRRKLRAGEPTLAAMLGLSQRQFRGRLDPNNAAYDPEMAAMIHKRDGKYILPPPHHVTGMAVGRLFDVMKTRAKNAALKQRDGRGQFRKKPYSTR